MKAFATFLCCLVVVLSATARADIFRWDNGELIPGTQGITPGPGVVLDHHELGFAALFDRDLTGARFDFSDLTSAYLQQSTLTDANLSGANLTAANLDYSTLTNANLSGANLTSAYLQLLTLTNANLSGANLTGAELYSSTLTNTNLTGAVVTGAKFIDTTSRGFTQAQLASTASYQTKNLQGIGLHYNDLTGWDFSGQNLTGAYLLSTLTNADLTGANLTNANLYGSTLTNANLTGAVVTGTGFGETRGFTHAQLASTADYQAKNLQGIGLGSNDLTGWDFSGQNLTGASLHGSTLTHANLTGANLTGANLVSSTLTNANLTGANLTGANLESATLTNANLTGANLTGAQLSFSRLINANLTGSVVTGALFGGTTSLGFTKAQLASTASYQTKNLQGIGLWSNNLTGWDFSGQNLTGASLYSSTLTNANFAGAVVTGASFAETTSQGFTQAQLASTANYQMKNLQGIGLDGNNLTGWDFSGQNLTGAYLQSTLTNADLTGANLTNANLHGATLTNADLTGAVVTGASFGQTTSRGFTQAQLASTASYQTKNLQGIVMWGNDLTGWDFSGQNLTGAVLSASLGIANLAGANLTGAQLSSSRLINANLTGSVVTGASFGNTTSRGFTQAQLASTASYQTKNLQGIGLGGNDLTGWDFRGQNLTGANFASSTLTNANLTGADTRGAQGLNLTGATTRNAILPDGTIAGLNLAVGETLVAYADVAIAVQLVGAFSIDTTAKLDLTDNAAIVDYSGASPATTVREKILSGRGRTGLGGTWTGSGITSSTAAAANQSAADARSLGYAENATLPLGSYTTFHGAPVDSTAVLIAFTRTGDANLDGVVNDDDVTIVGATYAPGVPQPSWALGDFDYNGFVDDDDVTLLGALYNPEAPQLGAAASASFPVASIAAVPEPSTVALLAVLAAILLLTWRYGQKSRLNSASVYTGFRQKTEKVMRSTRLALMLWLWATGSAAYGQGQVLNRTLQHGGMTRSYSIYVPRGYKGEEAWPLVLNMHWMGFNAAAIMTRSGMNGVADAGKFLVAYPNATVNPETRATHWNEGTMYQNGPDDVGFLGAMIDELEIGYHVDSSRIYASGMSSGGMMSYHLGSELSGRIAAIASVAGQHPANPTAPRPLPVLHFFGTADPFLPFNGGIGVLVPPLNFRFPAVADVIDAWRDSNNSVGDPIITQLPNLNTGDGSTVTMIQYLNCDRYVTASGEERPAEVLFYRMDGAGHTWPGSVDNPPSNLGNVNRDINGSEEIWKFFSRHELPAAGSAWGIDADGTWSQATNWKNGVVRNAVDAQAVLGAMITQPHTVNLDTPITLGRIDFENTNGFTVAGTNSITLDVTAGIAEINVTSGSHTISAPVILADNAAVSVSPAASNLSITGGLNAANVNLVKWGAGTLTVNQLRAAGLTINGGKIVMSAGSSAPAVIGAPTIPGGAAPTATLDLTDNAAVLDYIGTNTVARVRAQLLAGRRGPGPGGSWTGMGITSSAAAAANQAQPDSRSLGYIDNATLPLGAYATFHGAPADNTSVLVAFTRTGDANLDGVVNDDDVTIVGATYAPGVPQPSWALGDFDYNGFVDDDDVTLLGVFYDPSAAPLMSGGVVSGEGAAAVPEPGTLLLAAIALIAPLGLILRRR